MRKPDESGFGKNPEDRVKGHFERGVAKVVGWLLLRELRGGVRGVFLRGSFPSPPFVLAMNHHSYFDGHLVYFLFRLHKIKGKLLVSRENLKAFPIFASLGALEAQRVKSAMSALKDGEVVAVFPEGELRTHGELGEFKRGAAFLAEKAGVPLVPMVARLSLRGFSRPEAYLWIGEPVSPEKLRPTMLAMLAELDQALRDHHPREPVPGYNLVFSGTFGFDEKLARFSQAVGKMLRMR